MQVALQGTTLHIDRVELGHAGLFACQATNEAGTAGAEVELSVHGEWAWGSGAGVGEARGPRSSAPLAGLVDLGRVGSWSSQDGISGLDSLAHQRDTDVSRVSASHYT